MVLSARGELTEADLPDELRSFTAAPQSFLLDLPEEGISLKGIERELLLRDLDKFHGNQTQAARYLDSSRRTLIYQMKKHGLRREGEPIENV